MYGLIRATIPSAIGLVICLLASGLRAQQADRVDDTSGDESGQQIAIYNSERSTAGWLSADDAARSFRLPPGFSVTLFAGEPDVRQPIAIALDGRGRLWVAENYTYAERERNFDMRLRDRILILEDRDHDGRHDRRTVFWDQAEKLSSVAVGLGGVWAMCPPRLLFLPDRDGDDVPDGPPVVMLDGWNDDAVRHNIANGLRFGPDGWLYGRHGIQGTSYIGRPGTPAEQRTALNCSLWRFHPTRHDFEVVVRGTTNPWGHDWDEHGELFFINTVIGHLWHALPGAHFERMYGEDFNPHLYELCPQTADHFHWDTRENWSDVRQDGVSAASSSAGGGHAHSGLLIYQGDNWPAEYRGDVFAVNFHGRRVNRDRLVRRGSGFVGLHEPDFLEVGDPWFRGLDLICGPDGGVYLNDWSDTGECHEQEGVHRTSGRIYKIVHGKPPAPKIADVGSLADAELVSLQRAENRWWAGQARMVLAERALAGADMRAVHDQLGELYEQSSSVSVTDALRAMWCLYVTGGVEPSWLVDQLDHPAEPIRVWAIRLLVDRGAPSTECVRALATRPVRERSGLVLAYLASALGKLPPADRWRLADRLAQHDELADDPMYARMIWYGIEPAVTSHPEQAIELAARTRLAKLRRFIARRLTSEIAQQPAGVERLVALIDDSAAHQQRDLLTGMSEALRGWRTADAPASWASVAAKLSGSDDEQVRRLATELDVVFGSGRAADELRQIVADRTAATSARRSALRSLLQSRPDEIAPLLASLLDDRELAADAVGGLATLGDQGTAETLIRWFPKMRPEVRAAALDGLTSRVDLCIALLGAIAAERIERGDVPVYLVRRMRLLNDDQISQRLDRLWPELVALSGEQTNLIEEYRNALSRDKLAAADLARGQQLYGKTCATCHRLYGEGGDAGPDLTGSNRGNLDYLLLNLLDPSSEVGDQYRMSVVELADGRVLQGVVSPVTAATIQVRTPTETIVLEESAVERIEQTSLSLMPAGILAPLSADEVRDLIAYLMTVGDPAVRD